MSQWLTHPYLLDPSTGEPLKALGVIGGRPVWPVIGGSEEDDTETQTDETETDTEDVEEASTDEKEAEADESPDGVVTRKEFDALFRRMQAADRRASAAEGKVKEYEKANQSESERLQSERDEAVEAVNAMREQMKGMTLRNAFLMSKDAPKWADAEDALDLLTRKYSDDIEIDDNGNVTGMDAAVKRLAKEKPYLIVKEDAKASSGDAMNGKRKGDDGKKESDAETLRKRFPALGR